MITDESIIQLRWRSFPLNDAQGNTHGESAPQLEYFNGKEWVPVPQVCIPFPR